MMKKTIEKLKEALESYRNSLRLNPDDMEAKYNYAYTKRLLEQQQQQNQQNNQNQDQNQNQNDQNNQDKEENQDNKEQKQNDPNQNRDQQKPEEKEEQQREGISPQEREAMLEAIQAQEDKTQEKVKEKQGVVVFGNKNW